MSGVPLNILSYSKVQTQNRAQEGHFVNSNVNSNVNKRCPTVFNKTHKILNLSHQIKSYKYLNGKFSPQKFLKNLSKYYLGQIMTAIEE